MSSRIGQGFLLLLMGLAAVILLRDLWRDPYLFAQIIISGLQLGFVYALIALGYTMVYGVLRLINFAHGDVFMVGAFVVNAWYKPFSTIQSLGITRGGAPGAEPLEFLVSDLLEHALRKNGRTWDKHAFQGAVPFSHMDSR